MRNLWNMSIHSTSKNPKDTGEKFREDKLGACDRELFH